MALPCVLFSSSSDGQRPDDFVKKILKVSELPEPSFLNDSIKGYQWSFETKYYTATIHLCTTDRRTIGNEEFADNMQAFIHAFDPNKTESFELTKAWLPYLNHIEPVVQILVCDTSKHSDVISRNNILNWCVEHGFELVELSPEEDSDDEEDDFPETTGIARIVQALHSHTWSNLEMKDNPSIQSPFFRQMMKEQHLINQQESQCSSDAQSSNAERCEEKEGNTSEKSAPSKPSKETTSERHNPDKETSASCPAPPTSVESKEKESKSDTVLEPDDVDWRAFVGADNQDSNLNSEEGVEEFEELFQKLKFMKDKAEHLPPEERKKYAEKVALSFWKAIGGDEGEIAGLDEDSD